jgi:hypothetical protein
MVIPYNKIVLAHKLVFTLLYLNVFSSIFVWYSFTTWMHFLLGAIYFYTLFKIEWKPKVSGRPVFVVKVIAETLLALWLMLLSFLWLLVMNGSDTIASGKGYKVENDGFFESYYVLHHHLYIVERPYAYLMDLGADPMKGQITSIAVNNEEVTITIDTQTYHGYLFGKK